MKRSRLLAVITLGLILAVTVVLSGATPALALPPTVASATPNAGDQGESLSVAIGGTDFTWATSVSFGAGIAVNSFTVDNDTQITAAIAVSAWATAGIRDVSVTNVDGTGTLAGGFTVNQSPPEIESVSPDQGVQGQTDNVTITGSYFTGATSVDFGSGITANSFVVNPSAGSSEVQVGTGTSEVALPFYTSYYDARTQSILLSSEIGQPGVIQKLRLYCAGRPGQDLSNFYIRMQHTALSSFSSTAFVNGGWTTVLHATNVDVDAWTVPGWVEFEFTTPFNYDGVSNLLIDYCLDNTYSTSYGLCHYTNATNRSIYYSADLAGGDVLEQATGTNRLSYYMNVALVMQGDTIEASITIDGAAAPGYRDILVTAPGGTDNLTNGFTVLARPAISSVAPTSAIQGEAASITITGANLVGVSTVGFGSGITVNGFTVDSDTQITAGITVGAYAATGTRDVSVTKAGVTENLTGGFTVNQAPPVVGAVVPGQGIQGQTENVTIVGAYLTGATSVDFGPGITTNSFVVTPSAGASQVQVGTGTVTQTYPFHTYYDDTRTQSILLASEVGQPGQIQRLRLYCSTRPGQNLSHFYIRMQHTAMSSFPSTSYVNSGWTTVLHATGVNVSTWTVPGWVEFELTTPFEYNGVDNLLIDYCVDNTYYTSNGSCYSTAATGRTLYYNSDLSSGNLLNRTTGNLANWYNNVVLVMQGDVIEANITIEGAATPGYRDVSVATPGGTDNLTNGFMVLAVPIVSSVSPVEADQGQALSVTITGTSFFGVTAVSFGSGITVNSFTVDNSTQITAGITVSGSATVGPRDVTVTNGAGTATLTGGFTVDQAPPTISSATPSQGVQTQTLDVTVSGTYFTGATSVIFGADITTNSFNVDSATQVTANITIGGSAAAGLRDFSVTTPGGTATRTNGFTVLTMPAISGVSPGQGDQGQTLSVTITGTNFDGMTAVGFGSGITVNSFTVDNATQITAGITIGDWATVGARDVSVTKAGAAATMTSGFTVDEAPPAIGAVDPAQGIQGQTENVTISGNHFTGATAVDFGAEVTVNSYTVDSDTQITVNITIAGGATPGYRDVSVTTPEGSDTESNGFVVLDVPALSSVSPVQAFQGESLSVTITGTNLSGTTTVGFGPGIAVNSFTVDNSTQITAGITVGGSAAVGTRDVTVTNGAGTATLTGGFTVNQAPPTITVANPAQGVQTQTLDVTITGTYLTGATSVSFGVDIATNSFTVDSATQVTANITIGGSAAAGLRDFSVTTPGGTATRTNGFTVLTLPTITSVIPPQADQGQTTSVTITGANLTEVTAVGFGAGISVDSFTVNSDTQITAGIAIGDWATVGARDVTLTKAGFVVTLTSGFTVDQAPPVAGAVVPGQGLQGQTENVTITGTHLTGATSVDFGPGVITNSFVVTPATSTPEVQVGTGTVPQTFPFHTFYDDTRTQSILLAGEIGQPGQIQRLRLYCSGRPGQNLTHYYIRMQHTAMSSFSSSSFVNSGWTTVLHATGVNVSSWSVPGWVEFELAIPFDYNGVDNLLIDYCVDNSYYTSNGYCYSTTATNRTLYYYADLGSTDLLNRGTGNLASWYNNVVLVMYADTIEANITVSGAATPGYRDVSVTTPEGTDTAVNAFMVVGIPTISSLSPSQEIQGQTTGVTITGTNLFGVTTVDFGPGITVNSFSVDSGTQITANITVGGSAATGTRDVSVTNAAGTATLAGGFTINQAPPTLASVNPDQGPQGQNLDVTVAGSYFTGATGVSFGADVTTNSFTVDSAAQITANVTIGGSAVSGLRDVSVTTPWGTATLPNGFTVLGIPAISLANPNQGAQGQTLGVTVSGSNLTGATSVSFGVDVTTNSFTVDSATQITANISIGAGATPGMRDVSVTAPGGTATLTNGFIVVALPTLASVLPAEADQGQTLSVTLTGGDLLGVTTVGFGAGITVNSFTVDNSTQITAGIAISGSAAVGSRDVSVTNAAGTATLTAGFTVNQAPPAIASVSPGQGIQGQTENVTITGSYFTGATSVSFGDNVTVNSFTVDSDTQITANITIDGAAAAGYRDVSVTTAEGPDTEVNGFLVVALPDLSSVSPSEAVQGQALSVAVTGTDLFGVTTVGFGPGVTVNSFTVDNATQITASIAVSGSATTGTRDVSVTNAAGTATLTGGFTVNQAPPAIASVSPAQGIVGQTDNVTITGSYFTGATAVSFGAGITTDNFTVDNDTQITVGIAIDAAAAAGYRDVSVTTAAGTDMEANGYLVVGIPTVASVSPGQAVQGQTVGVTITGTSFLGATTVGFGAGITVNSFTVDNSTQITVSIAISGSAAVGTRDVSVTNAAGTATLTAGFTVNQAPPTISSVSPKQGLQGRTLSVTVWGGYFTGASAVSFGPDTVVNSYMVNNSGQITASITIGGSAAPGLRSVTVTTAAGTATLPNGFTVVGLPAVISISPSQAAQGETVSVTITGTSFLGATAVGFGPGITVNSFTVDSDTQITASITISDSAAAGAIEVSVTTRAGAGSLADGFTVAVPSPDTGSVTPESGAQGASFEVVITGAGFTGATDVSFGEGVTVESFTVDSPTQITARVRVAPNAAPGTRDVLVVTPDGTVTLSDVFEVQTEAGSGGGGVPAFVWVLIGLAVAGGLLLLGFLLKRRRKQEAAG